MRGGFFIKRADGTPWQWDLWQPGLAVVDFTNPEACKWYGNKLEKLIDLGVDTFKASAAAILSDPHSMLFSRRTSANVFLTQT